MIEGLRYAFWDLLGGIGAWLVIGIIAAGAIGVFVPPAFIEKYLDNGFMTMLLMITIAVPLYVCATGSTPIAAALALKGLSPGAVMVFLLAGPATNAASLVVISKILGKRITAVYVAAIVVISLGIGMLTNYFYLRLGLDVTKWVQESPTETTNWVSLILAIVLLLLISFHFFYTRLLRRKQLSPVNCGNIPAGDPTTTAISKQATK